MSPGQISLVVPYATTGSSAAISVRVNGVESNTVEVPLAPSAPGVFSLTQNGLGDGAILHADYSVVDANNPAIPGEAVQIFLSGMGAVTPSVTDGAAAPTAAPFPEVNAQTAVTIGGLPAQILFNGLAPGLASLYQLNVRVPTALAPGAHSLAIQTPDGFTDMVSIHLTR